MTADAGCATTCHVVTAVWGAEFIDLFLRVAVRNQLSPGNLPALPAGSRYRVFTTAADRPGLLASAALAEVGRVMPVDVIAVDAAEFDGKAKPGQIRNRYKMMTACHRRAIADAAGDLAALIFLSPDMVLAEGTMAALTRIHGAGARAVLSTGVRLGREGMVEALARHDAAALAPRELVRLAMEHLHPASESLMVDGVASNSFPTSVYWPVRSGARVDGLLIRSLHMHPLLLDPVRRQELPSGTIDGHFLKRCCPKLKQVHFVDDSDELVIFEMTPAGRAIGNDTRRRGVSMLRLAAVAGNCDAYQLSHWRRPIRLHAGDLDPRWRAAEAASDRLVADLERYRPYGPKLFAVYRLLNIWRQRRERYGSSIRKALRPRMTVKQVARPAKLLLHRALKELHRRRKRSRRGVAAREAGRGAKSY
jgi:hypothetical protein